MRIVLYGGKEDLETFSEFADTVPELQYRMIEYGFAEDYDSLLNILKSGGIDVIAVLMDGAEGMEGVIASESLAKNVPVIWFSDDKGFGVQAHRLECAYFGTKPITAEKFCNAYKAYRGKLI